MRVILDQIRAINKLLETAPLVGQLIYQGQSLRYWLSPKGVEEIGHALAGGDFDPVAARHGIQRLRLGGGEVVWDYPTHDAEPSIVFDDGFIRALEEKSETICSEVLGALELMEKFPDSDALTNDRGLWSFIPFFTEREISKTLQLKCPETVRLISQFHPNILLGFCFISVLSGGTTISAHRGSTSLRKRYHLGIKVPERGRAKLRVDNTWLEWEEGRAFAFNDSLEHEVVNESLEERVALIVDIWPQHLPSDLVAALEENPHVFDFCVLNREKTSASQAIND